MELIFDEKMPFDMHVWHYLKNIRILFGYMDNSRDFCAKKGYGVFSCVY